MQLPETRYTTSSGNISIAYQVAGEGPPDIAVVPGFVSHGDYQWEIGPYRGLLEQLSSIGRTAVFDKRGSGLSDRSLGAGTVEDRMDDIRAVMDTVGWTALTWSPSPRADPWPSCSPPPIPSASSRSPSGRRLRGCGWGRGLSHRRFQRAGRRRGRLVVERWGTGSALDLLVKGLLTDDESLGPGPAGASCPR